MARIRVYEQQIGVPDAADIPRTDYTGEAFQALGQIGSEVVKQYVAVQDAKGKEEVYTAASRARAEWTNKLNEMYSQAPLGAAGVHDQFEKEFAAYVQDMSATVSPNQTALFKRVMTDVWGSLSTVSMEQTIKSRASKVKNDFEVSKNDALSTIFNSPQQTTDVVSKFEEQVDTWQTVSADMRAAYKEQFRQEAGRSVFEGLLAKNKYAAAREFVARGGDGMMSAEDLYKAPEVIDSAVEAQESMALRAQLNAQRERDNTSANLVNTLYTDVINGTANIGEILARPDLTPNHKTYLLNISKNAPVLYMQTQGWNPKGLGDPQAFNRISSMVASGQLPDAASLQTELEGSGQYVGEKGRQILWGTMEDNQREGAKYLLSKRGAVFQNMKAQLGGSPLAGFSTGANAEKYAAFQAALLDRERVLRTQGKTDDEVAAVLYDNVQGEWRQYAGQVKANAVGPSPITPNQNGAQGLPKPPDGFVLGGQ